MRWVTPLVAIVMIAGCARLPAPVAKPRPAVGPEIVVLVSKRGQEAKTLIEHVAARCWLDGIVRGAQLIVDRQTGNVIIVGETTDLLAADFLRPKGGRSRVRLSGPIVNDPAKRLALVQSLDKAVLTGETSCPILTG